MNEMKARSKTENCYNASSKTTLKITLAEIKIVQIVKPKERKKS